MVKLYTITNKTKCGIEPHLVLPNKVQAHITHYDMIKRNII